MITINIDSLFTVLGIFGFMIAAAYAIYRVVTALDARENRRMGFEPTEDY